MKKQTLHIFVFIMVLLGLIYPNVIWTSSEDITITIKKAEYHDQEGKYFVHTDREVFENVDSWLCLKFNSPDVQKELIVGVTYTVKVSGWRWEFFSMYRNIILVRQSVSLEP